MIPFKRKKKHKMPKNGELETGKILDNRARIIFKNTCELCYSTSFNTLKSRDLMLTEIANNDYTKHSNVVIVINIFGNNINSIIEFLANKGTLKTEIVKDEEEYIIVIGGTVSEYKSLIRNIPDLNNNIMQLVFDCLYQLDYRLFDTFIKDGVMKRDLFIYETDIEYTNTIDDYGNIVNIDAIMDLYSAVSGKIPLRRLCKFVNVTIFNKEISLYDILGLNCSYQFTDDFSIVSDKKVIWAGNEWTLNTLGKLLISVKDSIQEQQSVKNLYIPVGTKINSYITKSLDDLIVNRNVYEKLSNEYIEIYKYLDIYISNNFGENIDMNILSLSEYLQKTVSDDDIQYIDEVVSEEIMSSDEYFQYLLEQEETDNVKEQNDTNN